MDNLNSRVSYYFKDVDWNLYCCNFFFIDWVTFVIPLHKGTSFSFYKDYIIYSKKAKNILLIFTHDGRLLIVEPKYLAQLVKDTEFECPTMEISNEIQNSEDLLLLIQSYYD